MDIDEVINIKKISNNFGETYISPPVSVRKAWHREIRLSPILFNTSSSK